MPVFHHRLVKRCFTSNTGDLCAGTDLRQLARSSHISMQIPITWKNMFERRMGGSSSLDRHRVCTRGEFENTAKGIVLRIGRDESGAFDRASTRVEDKRGISTGTGSADDWFYRTTKYDVHARSRRYINNVNYIPPA